MMRPVQLRWIAPIAAILLFAGCSSDSGTGTNILQGDPNDPAFLTVKAQVDEVLDSLVDRSFNPLTNPWRFPLDTTTLRHDYGPFHPDDTVNYGYEGGWYTLYLGSFAVALNAVIVDSVMFMEGDNYSSSYSVHTTDIHVKSRILTSYDGDDENYTEQSFYCDASYSGVNLETVTVDADVMWNLTHYSVIGTSDVTEEFDIGVAIEDMRFSRNSGHVWQSNTPAGGTIDLTVTYTLKVTESGITTTESRDWTFDVTFSADGTASITVFSENTRWTYSGNFGS